MNQQIIDILNDELVLARATSHPKDKVFDYQSFGENKINFCSNNFLAFDKEEILKNYPFKNLKEQKISCHSNGKFSFEKEFEDNLKKFFAKEDCKIMGSYESICADFFESILNTSDAIIYQQGINPMLYRGVKLCNAKQFRFAMDDFASLEKNLMLSQSARLRMIVVEGVNYCTGQLIDLKTICYLAEKYRALVVLDDSFAVGVLGDNLKGSDEHFKVVDRVDIKIVDLKNVFCANRGGFILGNSTILELFEHRSKSYRNILSNNPKDIFVANYILSQLPNCIKKRNQLLNNAKELYNFLKELDFNPKYPNSAIVSCDIKNNSKKCLEIIENQGFVCNLYKNNKQVIMSFKLSAEKLNFAFNKKN